MKQRRFLSTLLILLLLALLIIEVAQPIIGNASGAVNMWQSAGGLGSIKNPPESTKGTWLNIWQGFRITVLSDDGQPSFSILGKDSLDLLFSTDHLATNNIFGVNHKTGSQVAVDSLEALQSANQVYTISQLYGFFANGQLTTEAPGDVKEAILNIKTIPYHLYGNENGQWIKQGTLVKAKMYGPSDDEISDTAAFYALFNAKSGDNWLWNPKGGFKDDEQSKVSSGKMNMMEVMANHEVVISVEPIVWNRLRNSATAWTSVCMYGTQSNIGYGCAQMKAQGLLTGGTADYGGYDIDLYGRTGRSAMVTTKKFTFKGGLTIEVPPSKERVTNTDVSAKSPGWSLHLYTLKPREEDDEIPTTSTWDEPDHPIGGTPRKVTPHKSQNPFDDPDPSTFDPETTPVKHGEDPYTHYRIVKCYETEKYKEDGVSLLERTSDGVFITQPTNPIVDIEDEKASNDEFDGSWHLKDWDVSDNFNPPLPDLWAALKETYTSKQHGTTEADGISLIDENDEEKVVTLYVHLLRKIKEDEPPEEEETGGTGNIIIQQSQISKTIHTNDKGIGGIWGNYTFKTQPAANLHWAGFESSKLSISLLVIFLPIHLFQQYL